MTSPIWPHNLYEDVFELLTSGSHAYASDFAGDGRYLFPVVEDFIGRYWTDANRKEYIEGVLARQLNYIRPIKSWRHGLRIYIAYHNRAFFGDYYLSLTPYKHQNEWRQNFGRHRHLQLAPRSHGKSRIYSFELPVRTICYQDNVRLLHITNVGNEAQKYLVSIRSQFEINDRIREDFGDLTKGIDIKSGLEYNLSGTWSKDMFYVRHSNTSLKDPTMQAIGMGSAITGARFDGIIGDDIIEKSDVDTAKKRDEIEAWWNVILELLDTNGWALMIGTRKNCDDLYERLQNKSTWTYSIDKAIIKYPSHYEFIKKPDENGIDKLVDIKHSGDGQVLAPDMWTLEQLLEKKLENETTPWVFDREQQQEVTEEKNKVFQMEWMKNNDFEFTADGNIKRLTDGVIVDFGELTVIDGTDLASSKKDSADYFVDITIAMDYKFNTYVIDMVRDKLTFGEQFKAIVGQHRTWGSKITGIEMVAYQAAMEQHLIEDSEVPATGVPRANDKVQRMFAIQPYFQNRKVYFLKGKMGLIKGELNDFPDGAHDDIPDALETAIQLGVERIRNVVDLRTKKMVRAITIEQFRDPEQRKRQIGEW